MKSGILRSLGTLCLAVAAAGPLHAQTVLDREFSLDPARVKLDRRGGAVQVSIPGGMREFRAGMPDLPWRSERIELPIGVRVRSVEVVSLSTQPIAEGVRIPSALRPTPGLGPQERTEPDPAVYSRRGFFPDPAALLGAQGFQRGANVAHVLLSAVRWDPVGGRLEAVTGIRLRLVLEPSDARPLARERAESMAAGPARGATGANARAASPGRNPRGPVPFKATQIPSLMGSPVDYVIITNEAMAPEFQRLADWKTESGVPAVVRTVSFIRQEYAGADDQERIRSFIRDAYSRWGTKWVLLGGDTDVLPVRFGFTMFFGGTFIATDLYYQCLEGNWNADGDHLFGEAYASVNNPGDECDLMPDVFVGRAPCVTQAQAALFVDKTLKYEKDPVIDYLRDILFFAEVLFPQDWQYPGETVLDGGSMAELVQPYIQSNPNLRSVRLYENYLNPEWKPGALPESRQSVLDSLRRGYNVAVHIGHGYRNVMHVGDGTIENSDAFALTNGDRLINLYAINCTSNAIDFPSIGEAFLLCPTGGAVTNIGSTHFDFPSAGQVYEDEYFRLVYQDSVNAVGESHALSKVPFVGYSIYDGVNRWTQMTLLMLGDPELRLYTGTPRTLAVSHASTMSADDTTLLVHVDVDGAPALGARVVAYRDGMDYRIATTDGAGDAVLEFRPDGTGSFTLTVMAYDCVPYQATVTIVPVSPPVLRALAVEIDDDTDGGSSGDDNGIVDAGETVDLLIPLQNNGGSGAPAVVGTLLCTDSEVAITNAACSWGTVGQGATVSPGAGFRIAVAPACEDQHEVPFEVALVDGNGRPFRARFQLVVRAPELRHLSHSVVDQGGNSDGRPDPGETVIYYVKLRNVGTGTARGVTGVLRNHDGFASVLDSTTSWGDIGPDQEAQGDALVFSPSDPGALLELEIHDAHGLALTHMFDLTFPDVPIGLAGVGRATSIDLRWTKSPEGDLLGYNCYRSTSQGGPFTKVTSVPTDRIATLSDVGLQALTRYYYRLAAVDSSGNESSLSPVTSMSTNPPLHTVFPVPLARETPSSVAVDHVHEGYPVDIVAGSDVLYMLHPDGQAPVDADGAGSSHGDFTTRGTYYGAGPSIADLDGGGPEIIGLSWGTEPNPGLLGDSMMVFVFDKNGQVKPGWPQPTLNSVWSSAAAGDIDGVPGKEIVFGSNGDKVYAFHADGTEVIDGDNDPQTVGVFRVLGNSYNFGTPALANLDGDPGDEIIYGSFDGWLYAWNADTTNVPGFPVYCSGSITGSVAVGYLDGPLDTQLDIVVASAADSLYIFGADGVLRRPAWPKWIRVAGTSKAPSPALADMNNDTYVDIVFASTNGGLYVFDRTGFIVIPWLNIRYSALTSGASESSPVVADISGDGLPDIVIGDENSSLAALSGTGTMLPGFPIALNAEVRGAAALCDCDGDGMSEIVLSGWDRNLYVWDYDFPFSPDGPPPWPQFHHDAARTGLYTNPVFVGVGDPPAQPEMPATLEFSAPSPNPARGSVQAVYAVPAASVGAPYEIAVFDLTGRRIQTLERGTARAGRFTATWNLRTGDGKPAGEGLYFLRITLGSVVQSRKVAVVR